MTMLAALKHQARGLSDLERELRRDQTIGTATDSIRTEIIAAHMTPSTNPGPLFAARTTPPRLPSASGTYNASQAKMASKNMMNDYRGTAPRCASNLLLTLKIPAARRAT